MTRPLIVVNGAVTLRGTSGSARVCEQYVGALGERGLNVALVCPPWATRLQSGLLNAVRDAWWDLWGAARARKDASLLISPCNLGLGRRGIPHVLVVHDVMILEDPQAFDPNFVRYFRALLPLSLSRATRVITTTQHTRQRLLEIVPEADVRVVPLPGRGAARQRGGSPFDSVGPLCAIMVGATEPHKNHVSGIYAVDALRRSTGLDICLRVLGPTGRAEQAVNDCLLDVDPGREWAFREVDVTDEVLEAAFESSWCLLQPSYNEGFGLPVVEACQWGLPVVHSGMGALNEVMSDASAGGGSVKQLLEKLLPLTEPSTWGAISQQARHNYQRFTWESFSRDLHAAVADLLPAGDA